MPSKGISAILPISVPLYPPAKKCTPTPPRRTLGVSFSIAVIFYNLIGMMRSGPLPGVFTLDGSYFWIGEWIGTVDGAFARLPDSAAPNSSNLEKKIDIFPLNHIRPPMSMKVSGNS